MDKLTRPGAKQRIRRDPEEWRDIITRFEQSGQTRDQFCAEHNLGISTFSRWRQRLHRAKPAPSPRQDEALFIELETPVPANPSQAWDVELELGTGVVLRLRQS